MRSVHTCHTVEQGGNFIVGLWDRIGDKFLQLSQSLDYDLRFLIHLSCCREDENLHISETVNQGCALRHMSNKNCQRCLRQLWVFEVGQIQQYSDGNVSAECADTSLLIVSLV